MAKYVFLLAAAALAAYSLHACSRGKAGAGQNYSVLTVDAEEFADLLKRRNVRLIDVRTAKEYAEGHLDEAENMDVNRADFDTLCADVHGTVAVYCRGGKRSMKAARRLAARGCTVYNLDGGIVAWRKAGKEVVTTGQHESHVGK